MADYILRKAAVEIAERYGLACGSVLGRHSGVADCIASEISGLPAADVVEVVRCRDCKYHGCNNENEMYCYHCFGLDDVEPYYYCCHGERKE